MKVGIDPERLAIDTSPLTERVARADVRAFLGRQSDDEKVAVAGSNGARGAFLALGAVGVAMTGVGVAIALGGGVASESRAVFTLIVGGLLFIVTGAVLAYRRRSARAYRIARFAERNGLAFQRAVPGARYTGVPFVTGHSHRREFVVMGRVSGRPVEFGNLSYREGTARTFARRCGYIAIRLTGRVPHMVLDAHHSNGVLGATLPVVPHRAHTVDVGAGRAFDLGVADGAADAARALFTGDRARQFARLAKCYDMEFRDDCLFLYSRRDASTCRAAQWREQLDDVRALAHESPTWPIWENIRARRRGWLASLPSMRMRTSPRQIVVAVGIALVVLVATFALVALLAWIGVE